MIFLLLISSYLLALSHSATTEEPIDCSVVLCPEPVCEDGFELVIPDGDCCPICEDTATTEEPGPTACTEDAKICPDGTGVGRVPPDCEFEECPNVATTEEPDTKCPVGTPLTDSITGDELFCGRGTDRQDCPDGYYCEIHPTDIYAVCCESTATEAPATTEEVSQCPLAQPNTGDACSYSGTCCYGKESCCGETFDSFCCACSGGSTGCFFTDACLGAPAMCGTSTEEPIDCCDVTTEPGSNGNPFCFEGHACCADGTWQCSIGDGKTFPCDGSVNSDDNPEAFGERCDTATTEEPGPTACTKDAKICSDGTVVGRVPPDCEFEECPKGPKCTPVQCLVPPCPCIMPNGCADDTKVCPDGSSVGRRPPECEFRNCPGPPGAQEGDSCDMCLRPLCACGLCLDGVSTQGCCGVCEYQSSKDGLECVYRETATGCPEEVRANAGFRNPVNDVDNMINDIGNGYSQFSLLNIIVCVAMVIGCICCCCWFKKCKGSKYRYVDEKDNDSECIKLNV